MLGPTLVIRPSNTWCNNERKSAQMHKFKKTQEEYARLKSLPSKGNDKNKNKRRQFKQLVIIINSVQSCDISNKLKKKHFNKIVCKHSYLSDAICHLVNYSRS